MAINNKITAILLYKHIFYIDLLALSIPSTVFLTRFSMTAFCTVKYMTSLSTAFGHTNRKCPKENLNLNAFGQGDYCNFLDIQKIGNSADSAVICLLNVY